MIKSDSIEVIKCVASKSFFEKINDNFTRKKATLFSILLLGVLYLIKPELIMSFLDAIWQVIY